MTEKKPSKLLGGRYVIETLEGKGAFAEVFRGRDEQTGQPVAIKWLRPEVDDPLAAQRFEREARLLAAIRNPHVVGYHAHGCEHGRAWMALEWLDGEDLRVRQQRCPLDMPASVEVVRQAATGLAALHDARVIHRDIKPSNFFLVKDSEGSLQVKLIDLGVARAPTDLLQTSGGLRIGTPAYMSPEQAAGEEQVRPASDLYSLGTVLFELLTGRRPYTGRDAFAVLAKIVLEEAPRVSALTPNVPPELNRWVARALDKSPELRFPSARAAAEALAAIDIPQVPTGASLPEEDTVVPSSAPDSLERRVVTTLFAALPSGGQSSDLDKVEDLATGHGATTYRLLGNRLLGVFGVVRSSGDETLRAGRVALAARAIVPEIRLAIATGRALTGEAGVSGQVIDRGMTELELAGEDVRLDELSARLLGSHFAVEKLSGDLLMRSELPPPTVSEPRLLGHETPFVDRDRELDALEDLQVETELELAPRAAIVTGGAGMGKSRLRFELLKRFSATSKPPNVVVARADPLLQEVPLGLLSHALRRVANVENGAADDIQRVAVERWLRRLGVSGSIGLACELFRVGQADDYELLAARSDPKALAARLREMVAELLAALAEPHGLVLVLEDLQWADSVSVDVVGWILDALATSRLFVVAFQRPAARAQFGALWSAAQPLEVELRPLTTRACEQLVRHVLGRRDDRQVRSIVQRSGGNPLFIEELIRSAFQGDEELPAAIQAAFQIRLDALVPLAKRTALAASVFGRAVWREALQALLPGGEVNLSLDLLIHAEVLAERPRSRFSSTHELVFRHTLLRDTAYAMIPPEERSQYHLAAAQWLETVGEKDDAVLARHLEAGGSMSAAATRYLAAAQGALLEGASPLALTHAEKGLALESTAELVVPLTTAAAEACHVLGRYDEGLTHSERAQKVARTDVEKLRAAAVRGLTLRRTGAIEDSRDCLRQALVVAEMAEPSIELRSAAAAVRAEYAWTAYNAGEYELAFEVASRALRDLPDEAPELAGVALSARHVLARAQHGLGDLEASLDDHRLVVDRASELKHRWRGEGARYGLGQVLLALGQLREGVDELARARDNGQRLGLPSTEANALVSLAMVQLAMGEATVERTVKRAVTVADELEAGPLRASAYAVYSWVALVAEQWLEAMQRAQAATAIAGAPRSWGAVADAVCACARINTGERAAGLALARQVEAALGQNRDDIEASELAAALVLQAYEQAHDEVQAQRFRDERRREVQQRLDRITNPDYRVAMVQTPLWRRGFGRLKHPR